ncbi:MAG: hypothetical protein M5U26_30825 [Planctomycetota bacterium]|nr:hypothetical protein [Planctomycetota bacterium]
MTTACFECGLPAEVDHHVVPRSAGGTRTVPLCGFCHQQAHSAAIATPALVRRSLAQKKARGEKTGGYLPYGWRVADLATGRLEPEPAEQAMIAAARRWRKEGLSLRKIGDRLSEEGRLPRSGGRWHAETVKALLTAEVAA